MEMEREEMGRAGAPGGGDQELRESIGNFPDSGEGLGRPWGCPNEQAGWLSLLSGPRQKLLKEGLPVPP